MIVLGVDVGKRTGLALLDFAGSRVRYVDSGAIKDDLAGVLDVRFFGMHEVAAVGIETPTQVFTHGRAKRSMAARIGIERNLLIAVGAAGEVRAVASLKCVPFRSEQAHEIRQAVLGKLPKKRADIDRLIGRMVPVLVDGWPKRSNDHERDAAIAALWMGRRMRLGRA